jgi:hypothetical protein
MATPLTPTQDQHNKLNHQLKLKRKLQHPSSLNFLSTTMTLPTNLMTSTQHHRTSALLKLWKWRKSLMSASLTSQTFPTNSNMCSTKRDVRLISSRAPNSKTYSAQKTRRDHPLPKKKGYTNSPAHVLPLQLMSVKHHKNSSPELLNTKKPRNGKTGATPASLHTRKHAANPLIGKTRRYWLP